MLSRDIHEQAGRDKAHFLAPLRRNAIKPTPVPPTLLATSTGPSSPQRKLSRRVSERLLRPIGLPRTARRVSAGIDGLHSLREEGEREDAQQSREKDEHEKKRERQRERRSESPTTRSSAGSDSDSDSDNDEREHTEHTEDTLSTGASLTDARRVLERVLVSETDKQRGRELSLPLPVSPSSHHRDSPSDGVGSSGRSKDVPPYSLSPSRCLVPVASPSSLAAENKEKGEKNTRSPAALNYPSLRVVNFKNVRTKGSAHLQSFVLHVFDLLLALPHRDAHSAGIDVLREAVTRVAQHEHVCRCRCFCHVFCTLHQTPNKRLREARTRWLREVYDQRDESLREALTELSVKVLRTSNVAEIEKTRDLLATAYLTLVVRAQRQSLCARASGSSVSNVSSTCSAIQSARSSSSSSSIPVSDDCAPASDMDKFRAMSELFDLDYFRTETFKELAQTHPQRAVVQRMEQREQKLSLEERVKNMQRKREQQRAKAAAALVHRYRSEQSRSRLSYSHGNNEDKSNHTSTDEPGR